LIGAVWRHGDRECRRAGQVVYGRVEARKAEAARQAPANLVFRGSGVVVFLALQQ